MTAECRPRFAQALAAARGLLHMSQQELAEHLMVSRALVAQWETGRCFPPATAFPALLVLISLDSDPLFTPSGDAP